MKRISPLPFLCLVLLLAASGARSASPDRWRSLDEAAQEAIKAGQTPGVVVLAGQQNRVLYRKAFGHRALKPEAEPMTVDTVFDMASLTKVVATTSAVMALIEDGKLRPNDPVTRYWPEWGQNGKERITIRQLLTHTSGLPSWENYQKRFQDPAASQVQDRRTEVYAAIAETKLQQPPDTRFVYSDLGFITLGEIVRRVAGEPLDSYVRRRVFEPLGMKDTGFNPPAALRARSAPTEARNEVFMRGEVHDPNAAVMAGVAGHAGLFSTADDLARFARMLLSSDESSRDRYPLSPATVRLMSTPHSPSGLPVRGLGWDIDTGYSAPRGDLFPVGSFGHTGFTGTSIWIDPSSKSYLILLANRVHPEGGGNMTPLRARAANIVAAAVGADPPARKPVAHGRVLTGLDVLQRDGFKALAGRKVGLITNPTGVSSSRASAIDLIHKAPGVELTALFSPEHGIRADVDDFVASSRDEKTGLPIHSLYGQGKYKPLPEQLQGLDTLVFDIQDVGVRYYTYITTLALAMEAAKENGLKLVVLDRPNPINGVTVDGPLLDPKLRSFAGWYRLPVRHGMTVGELAGLYNKEFGIGCDLTVISMENWHRRMWFDQTGLPWVNPSPNIRNSREAELYAGIGLLEAANLSVGRGTDTPFERFGAPWVDGMRLAAELNRRRIPGLSFVPVQFTPTTREFKGERCGGVDVILTDRDAFDGCRSAVEILDALVRLYPKEAKIERTRGMFGTHEIPQMILAGRSVDEVVASYQDDVREFRKTREPYLLYR